MSKNENNNETIKYEDLQIGRPYVVTLTSGAVISGILFSKREDLQNGNIIKEYKIMFDSATYVYLCDCQIQKIREVKPIDADFFKELENEYDVRCFDNDGKLLPASRILGNIFYTDNNLEKLSKEERKELIKHLYFTNKDILDIVETFLMEKKDNESLHKDKLSMLDATLELVNNYNRIKNKHPYAEGVYNLIFREIGVEKFINQIC